MKSKSLFQKHIQSGGLGYVSSAYEQNHFGDHDRLVRHDFDGGGSSYAGEATGGAISTTTNVKPTNQVTSYPTLDFTMPKIEIKPTYFNPTPAPTPTPVYVKPKLEMTDIITADINPLKGFSSTDFLSKCTSANPCSDLSGAMMPVQGKIVDAAGTPMPGANIYVAGNESMGTTSDANGSFYLLAPMGSEVVVSFMGMKTVTFKAPYAPEPIVMEEDATQLDDVVVTGNLKKTSGMKKMGYGLLGFLILLALVKKKKKAGKKTVTAKL